MEELNILYKTIHVSSFGTSVQAMMLLFQVCSAVAYSLFGRAGQNHPSHSNILKIWQVEICTFHATTKIILYFSTIPILLHYVTMLGVDHDFTAMSFPVTCVGLYYIFVCCNMANRGSLPSTMEMSIETIITVDKLTLIDEDDIISVLKKVISHYLTRITRITI